MTVTSTTDAKTSNNRLPVTNHQSLLSLALIGILALGLVLRLLRLDFQPLWWDEGYSVWFSGRPVLDMVRLTANDIHPPLYYALLHGWSLPFGLSPIGLRLFSVIVGFAAIPLAYALGRDTRNHTVGLLAALLVAINPLAIYYSQEVRMYGLATALSLAALWTGWRWAQPGARGRWGLAYGLSMLAGLYTLYYFALIPLAQTLWLLVAARRRWRAWLAVIVPTLLLYLPWLFYAGPKLLDYVAYKVVKDNDAPIGALVYAGRHLSAFLVGHLEGPLASLWPWALLIFIPLLAAFALNRRKEVSSPALYLIVCLVIPLVIGFMQQMRAPFLPDRFERVLMVAASALWLLVALGLYRLWGRSRWAAGLSALLLIAGCAASLVAFYITPRYAEQDYRPLITEVQHNAAPGDSIFAVFPWQVGYFWAYLPPADRPAIVASPSEAWDDTVRAELDALLEQGTVWFPEHLALGGLLETAAEQYLNEQSHQLQNRWYGDDTRLTAWVQSPSADAVAVDDAPYVWQNGVTLSAARFAPQMATAANERLFLDLGWAGATAIDPAQLTVSLWLTGPDGTRWTQRDVTPFGQPYPTLNGDAAPWRDSDRIALNLPVGMPPGDYELWAALLDADAHPIPLADTTPQARLGAITIATPDVAPPTTVLAIQHPQTIAGDGIDFLGYTRSDEPQLPGDDLAVSLYWLPDGPLAPDRRLFLQLLDARGNVAAGWEGPPIAWHPSSQWAAAIPLQSQNQLRIPADLAPGAYTLIAGLFDPADGSRTRWGRDDALRLGEVSIGARPHDFTAPAPQHALGLKMVGGHRLGGYDLITSGEPGSPVDLTLYWQPTGPTEPRYRVFVHVLGPDGTILTQHDSEPANGASPTTAWLAGETIADEHNLTLPPNAPPGPYSLSVGLYDPLTGQRLPFVDEAGNIVGDHVTLPMP